MVKIDNKKILNVVTLFILIIVPFFKFFSMNLELFGVISDYDSINPAIILYLSLPFLLFIYIKDIIDKKRRLDIFDYIFYALVFTGILSTIFSIDKSLAIFGKDFRHEGFLSILSYYLIFINYKVNGTNEDIKKYLKLIIVIGLINSVYALLQIYTDFSFILRYTRDTYMASGLCGNPNFFGSLIVTCLGIIISKILIDKKINVKDILILILLLISFINSQSTGPLLTLIITFIFLIVLLIIKKKTILKNILVIILVLICTYSSVYVFNKYIYKIDRCELCTTDLKETMDNGGNGRIEIWKNSIEIVKDNPIVGVGFDNFYLAYPNPKLEGGMSFTLTNILLNRKLEKKSYYIVDNAHNVYLHTLISTGILGLIPYLLLCLLTFLRGLNSKNKLSYILLAGFVAYSIQAFANISVVQVAPIYYLLIGLILSIKE